ncbi:SEC-C metal-binding domain-containing protein [Planococcus sp. YIM B11945]|uniref:SEC-C metal-binding domain-containing protein n=1 Tax=Planococcus sp. YIM B11945 TaxID=3435410 RepID=UPI003D7D21BB
MLEPYFPKFHSTGVDSAIHKFAMNIQLDTGFNNSLMGLLAEVQVSDERDIKEIAGKAINFSNHHRLWANRGHSPKELSSSGNLMPLPKHEFVIQGTESKVGRNDPCPCGSVKKYKKCCGK